MTDQPNGRTWLSRDTFVPWGAALAFASLAWWAASKYGELTRSIDTASAAAAERLQEQASKLSLEMQEIKMTVQYQGRDLSELKKSVDALTRGSGK